MSRDHPVLQRRAGFLCFCFRLHWITAQRLSPAALLSPSAITTYCDYVKQVQCNRERGQCQQSKAVRKRNLVVGSNVLALNLGHFNQLVESLPPLA